MVAASSSASSYFCINAPTPVFTSSTIPSEPAASFLLMIELAISGMESTVAVTFLKAYICLSAGTRRAVWAARLTWILLTTSTNFSFGSSTCIPGMDSSLSTVPPVWPSSLPVIFATIPPLAATSGARTSVVLSPTPPVECLSTLKPSIPDKSTLSPESTIAIVKSTHSVAVIPLKYMAIKKAAIW